MSPSLSLLLLLTAPLLLFLRVLYRLFVHPLSPVPGPLLARCSRLWLLRDTLRFRGVHLTHLRLHSIYGPVVRVGPNHVLISNHRHGPLYYALEKSDWWFCLRPPGEKGHLAFSTELGLKPHNAKKKRVAGAYSMSAMLAWEDSKFDARIAEFVGRMEDWARKGEKVDLSNWLGYLNSDLLLDVTCSGGLGCVKEGKDVRGLIAANQAFIKVAAVIGIYPVLFKLMELPIIRNFGPKPSDEEGAGVLFGTAERQVQRCLRAERRDSSGNLVPDYVPIDKKPQDMLQTLTQWRDPQNAASIPPRDLKNEILVAIFSGADTVSCIMCVAMLHLSVNAVVRDKLRAEIEEAERPGRLSRPVAKFEEIRRLEYANAVFKEVLRIHPPASSPFWRVAPATGLTLDGHFIPGGTHIGMNEWVNARSTELFGDDVDVFRPERWLEADDDLKRRREKSDLIFAHGDCACLGKSFATITICKFLVEMVRRFDVVVVRPENPWTSSASISFEHHDFWCRVYARAKEGVEGVAGAAAAEETGSG